jgi:SynChlorMet cassette radical SAM/SPASM protein ScmF
MFHISVSLDGADADTHEWVRGVKGCFDAALDGIRNLVAAGIRPQVIMTLMRRNAEQIEALVRLAESLSASSVKFNIVQPTARGVKMHEAGETLSIREIVRIGEWVENELSAKTNLPLHYSHPAAFRPLGKMYGREGSGCSICGISGILGVLGGGSYALCGIGETVPELVFGHASNDPLADVWKDNSILREIREGLPRRLGGICGDCLMKGVCLGSCIAHNYYRSRDLWRLSGTARRRCVWDSSRSRALRSGDVSTGSTVRQVLHEMNGCRIPKCRAGRFCDDEAVPVRTTTPCKPEW